MDAVDADHVKFLQNDLLSTLLNLLIPLENFLCRGFTEINSLVDLPNNLVRSDTILSDIKLDL